MHIQNKKEAIGVNHRSIGNGAISTVNTLGMMSPNGTDTDHYRVMLLFARFMYFWGLFCSDFGGVHS